MSIRYSLSRAFASAALGVFVLTGICRGAVLNVPQYDQEKDQWCWNAASQMVLAYKGYMHSQTEIARWAVNGANVPNYLYGSDRDRKGCDLILKHFGNIDSTGSDSAMSLNALKREMSNSRPVFVRWGWDSGGGHIIIIRGTSGDKVYLNDPWPANGQSINDYQWVVRGGRHTWTHTLQLDPEGSEDYDAFLHYYNLAQRYASYYNSTGHPLYLRNYYESYGLAAYYYYKHNNNSALAWGHYYKNMALAYYYHIHYFHGAYAYGSYYAMSYYYQYEANAYYSYYYLSGNTRLARSYYYYYKAFEYYYLAHAYYYYYAALGYYAHANYYYNLGMQQAWYYYKLSGA